MLDSIKNKSSSVIELLNDVRSSALLSNYLKRVSSIMLSLLQTELQRVIFELAFNTQFCAFEKMEVNDLDASLWSSIGFSLDRFLTVS